MAKRILIADDSVTIQKAFAMTFAGAQDVTLSPARSADEGLAIAQKLHPDLIIADAVMPGRTGYDLCASVRSDPTLRSVPVLILSSSQQPYDEGRGAKAGADGHLVKPWDTNLMAERVRELLFKGGAGGMAASGGHPSAGAAPGRPSAMMPATSVDDEYGEISIETSSPEARRARVPTPPPPPPPARLSTPGMPMVTPGPAPHPPGQSGHPSPPSQPAMRPSLIPGMRPGAMPPARPGTAPQRPLGAAPPPAAPPRPSAAPVGRTLMGLPAANVPIPGMMRPSVPTAPTPHPPGAAAHAPVPYGPPGSGSGLHGPASRGPGSGLHAPGSHAPIPAPPIGRPSTGPTPSLAARGFGSAGTASAISASVDQKLAALSAKGPEYEAIAKLSREIIEQVVWEVVPELAEAIIREHIEKRGIR